MLFTCSGQALSYTTDGVMNPGLSSCTRFSFYECLPKTYEKYQHGPKAFPKLIEEKEDTEGDVKDQLDE